MKTCRSVSRALLPALFILVSTGKGEAQQKLGTEFQIGPNNSKKAAVSADSAGNFVVVWERFGVDGSGYGISGQRYASSGGPLGTEFQVNAYTTGAQRGPSVATDPAGDFVVVWMSYGQDGSFYGIFGQRYDSAGVPLGAEFRTNSYTQGFQKDPSVALDATGNFVVAWGSLNQDYSGWGSFSQRYASGGARLGTEFRLNTYNTDGQSHPKVASDSAGNFVVIWESNTQDGDNYGVFGQRSAAGGMRLGTEFRISAFSTGAQKFPVVSSDPAGNFVVVWQSDLQDGNLAGVVGKRYNSSGVALGAEFVVNTFTTNNQAYPGVAVDSAGNFVVVWQTGFGASYVTNGQLYASSGGPLGSEFRITTATMSNDKFPVVASDVAGNFVVAWQRGSFLFGQRYCSQTLSAVSVSATGYTSICPGFTGGTATVTDTGGGTSTHQWYYRGPLPGGVNTMIAGQTGTTYQITASDFAPGLGDYALVCQTTPTCGSPMFSPETVTVTITNTDGAAPLVTAPANLTTVQTLCQ